jgi:Putative zincin peptidase
MTDAVPSADPTSTDPAAPEAAAPKKSVPDGFRVVSDATMSMERANVVALGLIPPFALLIVAHGLLWGWASVRGGAVDVFTLWVLLPLLAVSIVVHEALHGLGFLMGGAPRSAVHFGIHRPTLSPFCGCHAPLSATAYRVAVLLPGFALGVVPTALGLATGSGALTIWGVFMLITAAGDLAAFWAMRAVPGGALVMDHPERVGGRVVEPVPDGAAG